MIDWWGVFYNALWVVGLAICLAVLSMAGYQAREEEVRLRQKLGEPAFRLSLNLGLVLFCVGLLLSSRTWWERVLWGLLAVLLGSQIVWLWRKQNGQGP